MVGARPLGGLLVQALLTVRHVSAACNDGQSCQAEMLSTIARLNNMTETMTGKHFALQAMQEFRKGIMSGSRISLPSVQWQHLTRNNPAVSEVSFDAKHRPVSTNMSRHMVHMRTLAEGLQVKHQTFLTLKRSSKKSTGALSTLLVSIDSDWKLSLYSVEGDALIDRFSLGHAAGRKITHLELSPNPDSHFIVTADDSGEVRVHSLKLSQRREKKAAATSSKKEAGHEVDDSPGTTEEFIALANFSVAFNIRDGADKEKRELTAVMAVERGSQTYFVAGDSLGDISIHFRNGTLKGRVHVTDDPEGIRGLRKAGSQSVLFFSSHLFGFFSVVQIDVQHAPCDGWESPLFDVIADPTSSYARVILALADGDVVVYNTKEEKEQVCDMMMKFPHVSTMPFQLKFIRGHVMGLPTPQTAEDASLMRELFFFNMNVMELGYGVSPSRAVALQLSLHPQLPEIMSMYTPPGDRAKAQLALTMSGSPGIELYELSLKTPLALKAAEQAESSIWNGWLPKVGIFGIVLIGVVIWNVRKVTAQRKATKQGSEEEKLKEILAKTRERSRANQAEDKEDEVEDVDDGK
eukprot:gnl/TRDRNA2_/TRDRNA2_35472_c0_seq1.p1 gnl/TRDRNA2_/TRDRNA2_35472_c0~~gnl/TRDRNA2_/TRDRNA2_35472_c0_seq1.p1  ORF type:complete len:578 (-),score=138.14 gnl/TRDRNA2_/TRDRNA2_35472_c0_seq1:146-1879(-)